MRGFDYEAGVRIPYVSDYVETWAYVGGYNYQGRRVRDINGFIARLEVIPTDFIRLNYEFHHDNYSKAEHYGEISFEVPFSVGNLVTGKNPFEGIGDMLTGSRDLKARMVEPTRRDVDVKIIIDDDNENIPGGGEEIEGIVFVSETGDNATGDGTMERPYKRIGYAMNNDPRILAGAAKTIHVMNSSTIDSIPNTARGGTVDVADFLIWGSGVNHPKYPVINMPYTGHPYVTNWAAGNYILRLSAPNITVTGLSLRSGATNDKMYGIRITNPSLGSGIVITDNFIFMRRTGLGNSIGGIYTEIGNPIGSVTNPAIIANNDIDLRSAGGGVRGIFLRSTGDDVFAKILENDLTISGRRESIGIFLDSSSSKVGSSVNTVIISGNRMTVEARNANFDAYGIHIDAADDIFATITGNDLSNTITGGNNAYGIFLYSDFGNIGSETRPIIISGNPLTVTANNEDAYGINLDAGLDIFATITGNDMSNTIWGGNDAYGIYFYSDSGSIGSETSPVIIAGNPLTVTADGDDAHGIRLDSWDDIFATITGNDMSNTITGSDDAYAIYLDSFVDLGGGFTTGGSIGSETKPVIIAGNPMTVTAGEDANGIRLSAEDDIFATIIGNDMSNTIIGDDYAYRVRFFSNIGGIGSATRPVIISGNPMTVTANNDNAFGIDLEAFGNIFATIIGNDMSNTIWGGGEAASGILLYSDSGGIGSTTSPVIISGNPMTVTADGGDAFGIDLEAFGNIFATITGNDMSNTIWGEVYAYGISLYSDDGDIGSATRPVIIAGNPMKVTADGDDAYGIRIAAWEDIFATILGNDMSNIISNAINDDGNGIYLIKGTGGVGSANSPVIISGNSMKVTGTDDGYGIRISSENDVFATITGNNMLGGIWSKGNAVQLENNAYGVYITSDSGGIGSAVRPVIVSGNPMTVTADVDDADGINLEASNDLFATITGNNMLIWSSGDNVTTGIYLETNNNDIGSETRPVIIAGNSMTVTSDTEEVGGIYVLSDSYLFTTIVGNTMDITCAGDDYSGGIWLNSEYESIGSAASPVIVSGNTITANSVLDEGYGIWIDCNDSDGDENIFATITGNNMLGSIYGGDESTGIYIATSGGNIGSAIRPLIISGNPMAVTADVDDAYGIYLSADIDIFTTITENNMSKISGGGGTADAYGIYLQSNNGSIGSTAGLVIISGNYMKVTADGDDAYGVYLDADIDIFAKITKNYMNLLSVNSIAFGAYLDAGNLIGDVNSIATFFYKNYGTIDGNSSRYLLEMSTGAVGGGNYLHWGKNSFMSLDAGVGASWSGNYNAGDALPAVGGPGPVETNFGAGDTLKP